MDTTFGALLACGIGFLLAARAMAGDAPTPLTHPALPMRLWDGPAPGALGDKPEDVPTITPFLVDSKSPATAVVVFPGGGYWSLADHEGTTYARFFQQHGIAAFVVKYRLTSNGYHHPAMLQDAARAVRLVRSRAADFNIDPHRVLVIGSSAGGHLVSTLITHFDSPLLTHADAIDQQSARPDGAILCYAVITMGENTHAGSRENLLGKTPSPELIESLSNEKQVTPQTPPCFVWHTLEDQVVKVENALAFAQALRNNGVRFDLHIYEKGPHGIGLQDTPPFAHAHPWSRDLLFWMQAEGFIGDNK